MAASTRVLRNGILRSERVDRLTAPGEVFYRRLMSVVDDYGRASANLTLLRGDCYPLRIDSVKASDVETWLRECADAELVVVYIVRGRPYLQLLDFNQRLQGRSLFPAPDEADPIPAANEATVIHGEPPCVTVENGESPSKTVSRARARSGSGSGSGSESYTESESESGARVRARSLPPDGVNPETWTAWVKHKGRTQTAEADRLQRKHLAEWMVLGHDVQRIVEDAVAGAWKGLHAPDRPPGKARDRPETLAERRARNYDELTGEGDGRVIEGHSARVGEADIPALSHGVREPGGDDVGQRQSRRVA